MSYKKSERTDNSKKNKELELLQLAQSAVSRSLTPYETSQLLRGIDKTHLQKFRLFLST
ncbi:hypothetical protein [Legionella brunensis]|uniref:Uncharacterized protein n=1 Tax=Legionella brunensis TaxID=29422 RepID=A0A0W0STZ8_9GAMM|nr:hypothetical protein [Legionella brunensis]KTC86830.1 hypothetical protein Lbru_0771 [Legionella brunensis]